MLTVREATTLVGVSELRTKLDEVLKAARHGRVVLERRRKPVAVLLSIETYEQVEKIFGRAEDEALASVAKRRDARRSKRYVTLDEAERRFGVR